MNDFDAVLFDWMLTLAHYPSRTELVTHAHALIDRPVTGQDVEAIVEALAVAEDLPDVQAAEAIIDTSVEAHRAGELLHFRRAGIDSELAEQMYLLLGDADWHQPYPDAAQVLGDVRRAGLKLGVISDIHVDLRVHADKFGFGAIDAWALSFELGIQKPEPAIFEHALNQLGTAPERTLMVGDRHSRDGAAALLGLPCLILPAPTVFGDRGLNRVSRLVGADLSPS